jgi:hypothetical protein
MISRKKSFYEFINFHGGLEDEYRSSQINNFKIYSREQGTPDLGGKYFTVWVLRSV